MQLECLHVSLVIPTRLVIPLDSRHVFPVPMELPQLVDLLRAPVAMWGITMMVLRVPHAQPERIKIPVVKAVVCLA